MRYTWTVDEIHSCPMFGRDVGWFYGIVRERWRFYIVEIIPGFGYTREYSLFDLRWLRDRQIQDDLRLTPHTKAKYAGVRSPEQQKADEERLNEEIKNARPVEELFAEFGFEDD